MLKSKSGNRWLYITKYEEIQNYYAGKYAKADLLDGGYYVTDCFSDFSNKGKCFILATAVTRILLAQLLVLLKPRKDIHFNTFPDK